MNCTVCNRDFADLSKRAHNLDGSHVCRDCSRANGGVVDDVESLGQLQQMAWRHVEGAVIAVQSRGTGEIRRGVIAGRHVGERLYYDSEIGENIVTYDSEMVVIRTERGTSLEVPTDSHDLVEVELEERGEMVMSDECVVCSRLLDGMYVERVDGVGVVCDECGLAISDASEGDSDPVGDFLGGELETEG